MLFRLGQIKITYQIFEIKNYFDKKENSKIISMETIWSTPTLSFNICLSHCVTSGL